MLRFCTDNGIAFIPWYPVDAGSLNRPDGPFAAMAKSKKCTTTQLSLAWLLHKWSMMLPIPGTYSLEHLRENVESAQIELWQDEMVTLEMIGGTEPSYSLFQNLFEPFALRAPTANFATGLVSLQAWG